jgi:hypothetical protein
MASNITPAAAKPASIVSRTRWWRGSTWTCSLTADDLGRRRAGTSGMGRLLVAASRLRVQAGKSGEALIKF